MNFRDNLFGNCNRNKVSVGEYGISNKFGCFIIHFHDSSDYLNQV